jgi:hypothetical protein
MPPSPLNVSASRVQTCSGSSTSTCLKTKTIYGRPDRDYYVNTAVAVGADQATFEACYDGEDGLATVMELDAIRRDRAVFSQPIFDINGEIFVGAQPYESFAAVFEALP